MPKCKLATSTIQNSRLFAKSFTVYPGNKSEVTKDVTLTGYTPIAVIPTYLNHNEYWIWEAKISGNSAKIGVGASSWVGTAQVDFTVLYVPTV